MQIAHCMCTFRGVTTFREIATYSAYALFSYCQLVAHLDLKGGAFVLSAILGHYYYLSITFALTNNSYNTLNLTFNL